MKKTVTIFALIFTMFQINAQNFTKLNATTGFTKPIVVNNKLFFLSDDGTNGEGLYYIDNNSDQLHFVKTILGQPFGFTESGGKLFFVSDDGIHGNELWVSDGTSAGTFMLKDINQGLANTFFSNGGQSNFTAKSFKNKFYFAAWEQVNGGEVWVSDGTSNGTSIVQNIGAGSKSGFEEAPNFTEYNDKLYFFANDSSAGTSTQLWYVDGTLNNLQIQFSWSNWVSSNQSFVFNNQLFFQLSNNGRGDVVIMDSLYNLTSLYATFPSKSISFHPNIKVDFNGRIIVRVSDTGFGSISQYYLTNGLLNDTLELMPNILNKQIDEVHNFNGKLYVIDRSNGISLYSTDLSTTSLLAPGLSSYGAFLQEINGKVFFRRSDSYGGEPWITDGTPNGTSRLKDVNPGSGDGIKPDYTLYTKKYRGNIYFSDVFSNNNFWKTDGTIIGTKRVGSLADTLFAELDASVEFNGCLYFNAYTSAAWLAPVNLFKYCDGSVGVKEISESNFTIYPNPSKSTISIEGLSKNSSIKITNILGEIVLKDVSQQNITEIDISNLPTGMYFLNNRKFIKE